MTPSNPLSRLGDWLRAPSTIPGGIGNTIPVASPIQPQGELEPLGELFALADASDIFITERTAKSLPVVSKADRLLTTNLARMPLVSRKGGLPASPQMGFIQQPEADRPRSATITSIARALFYRPCAWLIVQKRDAYGWPARGGVKYLKPKDATLDADGRLTHAWGQPVEARDVIQFDSPDGGLLYEGRKTLRRAVILDRAASTAEENPVPSIDLHNSGTKPLDETQIRDLLKSWRNARALYGAAYTDGTIEAKPLGLQHEQLLIDAQRQMDVNLARQVGIPAWAADVAVDGASLNYTNRQSRAWELIDLYLTGYMTPIADRLSMNDVCPMGWTNEWDQDVLVRPDQKTRFDTYKVGIDGGFIDQAYIDAQEGQPLKASTTA